MSIPLSDAIEYIISCGHNNETEANIIAKNLEKGGKLTLDGIDGYLNSRKDIAERAKNMKVKKVVEEKVELSDEFKEFIKNGYSKSGVLQTDVSHDNSGEFSKGEFTEFSNDIRVNSLNSLEVNSGVNSVVRKRKSKVYALRFYDDDVDYIEAQTEELNTPAITLLKQFIRQKFIKEEKI